MISGFNTDIEFDGTVYHVQTEDKGAPARMIMSLVYDGGTIIASKRERYDDLAATNFDEKKLSERVSRQHKLICAAIQAGRVNELVDMTEKAATAASKARASAASPPVTAAVTTQARANASSQVAAFAPPIIKPAVPLTPVINAEPVIEAIGIIEDAEILSADAVEIVSELSGQERPSNSKLSLELLGETKFKGGERHTVNIMLCRGTDRKVVADAQIMIKVLGSSFRPVIFHAKSDFNGLAKVHLQLPHFNAGRAALLIRAMTGGEEIELRRIVTPG